MDRPVATSFDLFGTLVDAQRPSDPASAVADVLHEHGVSVPDDWQTAYREIHSELPAGAEQPLSRHVLETLASRGVDAPEATVAAATLDAFDEPVSRRDGAVGAIEAASDAGPVGVLSNCSVEGLVERTLERVDLPGFDAVVTSVDCGWRKPHPSAFEALASELGVPPARLVHVGDDPAADGAVVQVGGWALLLDEHELGDVPAKLGEIA